jgi:hydrogenase expression/formation protein HypC
MCLAVPGKIIDIDTTTPIRMGRVDFGGILREVCLEAVPEAALGDYVIVHAGFALNTLSEQETRDSLEAFKELDEIESELRSADESTG